MQLEGANTSALVSGTSPLPGKSNYFIGNDRSQWRQNIPQFGRVQYQGVYPGVDLVYYGNQGQLEYDFRIAPNSDPNQIALSFTGATVHVDAEDSGDLILSTANGDIRFHAPHIYQTSVPGSASGSAVQTAEKTVAGSFRQLADNKIGFTVGDYDHSRELVIDPILTYSTYLGGGGEGGLTGNSPVKIAVDAASNIYVAGSTISADFPVSGSSAPYIPPLQTTLNGTQNLFISLINPTPQVGYPQLVFSTYLGGSGIDSLAGIAVDQNDNIYVAGSTTSPNFPTTSNAFQYTATFAPNQTHGFVTAIRYTVSPNNSYAVYYSTYLAGNGNDAVTGLAIDTICPTTCNAYVTGVTTSSNDQSNGFPANPEGYQIVSNSPGNAQFFASKVNTSGSGFASMIYSTYFGGGNFGTSTDTAYGGGIAVDPPPNDSPNMYFTGTTNQLGVSGAGGTAPFPLFDAQQSCLNEAGQTNCTGQDTTHTDAFIAKINPSMGGSLPIYSTYLGGSGNDNGNAVAVDTSSNAYVVGATNSSDWNGTGGGFQLSYAGTCNPQVCNTNAFIAKIGPNNGSGTAYPITYFTYLGGNGPDSAADIKVDSTSAAHVVGTTSSVNPPFPTTLLTLQPVYGGGVSDAFVALISTTQSGTLSLGTAPPGDYSTYLGGSGTDQGWGVAIDLNGANATYVAGTTESTNFPLPLPQYPPPYQSTLVGAQDAFVSKLGAYSQLSVSCPSPCTSPSPNPVAAGTQVAFTFQIVNAGPDNASNVVFTAVGLPTTGLTKPATAQVSTNTGSCGSEQGTGSQGTISCYIPTVAACPTPCSTPTTVVVDLTPSSPVLQSTITISATVSANGGLSGGSAPPQTANVVDFTVTAKATAPSVNAGDLAQILVTFCPTPGQYGYNGTITPSQTISPSMVTATTPTFNPTTVTLSGTACGGTTLNIQTVPRPVNTGSLRHFSYYSTWLPIGGLSLLGLGIGAGRKQRRWLAGAVLFLIAGIILMEPGCGKTSNSATTPGGTVAGTYTIQITGTDGAASHLYDVLLQVN